MAPNELFDLIGGRLELVARMGEGADDTVLFRTQMAPGQLVPLHSHADPECFYLLAGRLEVFLLDDSPHWRALLAGRSALVANGIRHALRNPTSEPADIVVATNNRLAQFFSESGRRAKPGTHFEPACQEDIERVVRTAKTYGYWLSSPEEHAALTGAPVSGPCSGPPSTFIAT